MDAANRAPLGDSPIRVRRLSRGRTLKQVAIAAGLSPACVAHIETGRNKGTPKTLAAIERALNMPIGALRRCGAHSVAEPEAGEREAAE